MKLIWIAFCFMPALAMSQTYQNVMIDLGKSYNGPEEPAIAISLTNPDIIIAGANIKTTYRSKDGGLTWKKKVMKSKYGVYGDPCIVASNSGRFMYFHLSLPYGQPYKDEGFLDRIVCQRSNKRGKRFHRGSYMGLDAPKDQDKEWGVYDSASGRTYVTWTQFDKYDSPLPEHESNILGAYSDDEGKSWSEAFQLSSIGGNCLDDDGTTEGAVPAMGLNGEMHVAWALNEKIYFNTYTEGQPIPKEKVIANQMGGWDQQIEGLNRTNGMPVTVSDMSQGPNRGAIYVSWSDQRNGDLNTDVFIKKSIDGGKTWSKDLKVNDDNTFTHQYLPWLTIDQSTGYLYVLFYDRRAYTDNNTDVYVAVSKNGGVSFENVKISERPFAPHERVFFGDYINISAVNGRVRPIWTRYENGELSIWTALIEDM